MRDSLHDFLEYSTSLTHDDYAPRSRRASNRDDRRASRDEASADYLLNEGIDFLPSLYNAESPDRQTVRADRSMRDSIHSDDNHHDATLNDSEEPERNGPVAADLDGLDFSSDELYLSTDDSDLSSDDDTRSEPELSTRFGVPRVAIRTGHGELNTYTDDEDNHYTSSDHYYSEPAEFSSMYDSDDELSDLGFSGPVFTDDDTDVEAHPADAPAEEREADSKPNRRSRFRKLIFCSLVGIPTVALMGLAATVAISRGLSYDRFPPPISTPDFTFQPVTEKDRSVISESILEASAALNCDNHLHYPVRERNVVHVQETEGDLDAHLERDIKLCNHLKSTEFALTDILYQEHANFSTALSIAWTMLHDVDSEMQLDLTPATLYHMAHTNPTKWLTPRATRQAILLERVEGLITGLEWYEVALEHMATEMQGVMDRINTLWAKACNETLGVSSARHDTAMRWLMGSFDMRVACIVAGSPRNSSDWLLDTVTRDALETIPRLRETAAEVRMRFYEAVRRDGEFMAGVNGEVALLTKMALAEIRKYASVSA